jgi:hypothetical protein
VPATRGGAPTDIERSGSGTPDATTEGDAEAKPGRLRRSPGFERRSGVICLEITTVYGAYAEI